MMSIPAPPAPPPRRSTSLVEAPRESAVTRLLITPLTFVSFLLSLAILDRRNASQRGHAHNTPRPPVDTFLGWVKDRVQGWIYNPQPYSAHVSSSTAPVREKSGGETISSGDMKEEVWHWNAQQRKMIKAEVEDAFQMRRMVVVAMTVTLAGLAAGLAWLVSWLWPAMLKSLG